MCTVCDNPSKCVLNTLQFAMRFMRGVKSGTKLVLNKVLDMTLFYHLSHLLVLHKIEWMPSLISCSFMHKHELEEHISMPRHKTAMIKNPLKPSKIQWSRSPTKLNNFE